jgi:hypothetical protein
MDGWYVDTKHFFKGFHVPQLLNPDIVGSLVALTLIILFKELWKFSKKRKNKKMKCSKVFYCLK